jgi:hypothetical protein
MALCKGGKLRSLGDADGALMGYGFHCPGCDRFHAVYTAGYPSQNWTFNGDTERPTFTPSLLVQWDDHEPPVTPENIEEYKRAPWTQSKVHRVCHSFITDGRIQFLGDCTHALAGQTVEIPPWPESKMAFEDHHS